MLLKYVPAAHNVHVLIPLPLPYVPAPHALQPAAAPMPVKKKPVEHNVQALAPVVDTYVPTVHPEQMAAPAADTKVPAAQALQLVVVNPVLAKNVPGTQNSQALAPVPVK